eukprot:s2988_g5.t1
MFGEHPFGADEWGMNTAIAMNAQDGHRAKDLSFWKDAIDALNDNYKIREEKDCKPMKDVGHFWLTG